MEAVLLKSQKQETVESYEATISINEKRLLLRVRVEDGAVTHYCSSVFKEANRWNQLSQEEKDSVEKLIYETQW